jgi:hypothetical protein
MLSYRRILFILFTTAIIGCVLMTACTKSYSNGSNSQTYTTSGNASGAQENPPVSTSGMATLSGTYNAATKLWQYNVSWSSVSDIVTVVEVRGPASLGVNGNLMFTLTITTGGRMGTANGNVTLTAQQEADFLAGKTYFNIVDPSFVSGEIRGQIYAAVH